MASSTLTQWMNGVVNYVRASEPDLTNRQLAVLMMVHYRSGQHTVRGLAHELNVSKPVITRALDKLSNLGLLMRQPDETDGRNVFIVSTATGAHFLAKFEDYFANDGQSANGRAQNGYLFNESNGAVGAFA